MQTTYKTELERLTKEGIITEVKEHTEWINWIVPVMKPNGSIRLFRSQRLKQSNQKKSMVL